MTWYTLYYSIHKILLPSYDILKGSYVECRVILERKQFSGIIIIADSRDEFNLTEQPHRQMSRVSKLPSNLYYYIVTKAETDDVDCSGSIPPYLLQRRPRAYSLTSYFKKEEDPMALQRRERCLLTQMKTNCNHLQAVFTHDGSRIVTLNDVGQQYHTIVIYHTKTHLLERSFEVPNKSAFMQVSEDNCLLAVGQLGEELVKIYDFQTGELLVDLVARIGIGHMGEIKFLGRNNLMEIRNFNSRGQTNKSSQRMWDLGFNLIDGEAHLNTANGYHRIPRFRNEGDDDDEQEVKLWEKEWAYAGHAVFIAPLGTFLTCLENGDMKWISAKSGEVTRTVSIRERTSRVVLSNNGQFIAVGMQGKASVFCASSGRRLNVVPSPLLDDNFICDPLAFTDSDKCLVMRIHKARTVIICDWHTCTVRLVAREIGSTISDACECSRDGKYLVCWPYGNLELYDLHAMRKDFSEKYFQQRQEFLLLKRLWDQHRLTVRDRDKTQTRASPYIEKAVQLSDLPFHTFLSYLSC